MSPRGFARRPRSWASTGPHRPTITARSRTPGRPTARRDARSIGSWPAHDDARPRRTRRPGDDPHRARAAGRWARAVRRAAVLGAADRDAARGRGLAGQAARWTRRVRDEVA